MATRAQVIADIQAQYGRRQVLFSEELGEMLGGKSRQAIANIKHRGGLGLPVRMVGGRPAVAVADVADFLSDENPVAPKSKTAHPQRLPPPKRQRPSLGKTLLTLRAQIDFLSELFTVLEKIDIAPPVIDDDKVKQPKKWEPF